MLIVQVRTPKVKLPTHRTQNSQPSLLNSSNFNSFQEYFKSQSSSKDYSITKGDLTKIELKRHHAHKGSNQSTTISLTNSTSRNQGMSKKNQKSNSPMNDKIQPKNVNPFQDDETSVNQRLQMQLKKVVTKTKEMLEVYETKYQKQMQVEERLSQEIVELKKIIEKQRKVLIKNKIQIPTH